MSREMTKKRVRSKARRKQLQRQRMMMTAGLALVVVLIVVIAVFALGSCGAYDDTDTNTVYILENGKVVSTSVEAFDDDVYSKSEMKSYMKDVIKVFNDENGSGSAKQKSFDVKDDVATLVMEYANAEMFEAFEGTDIFVGTIAEAVAEGYTFEDQFAKVNGDKVEGCDTAEFMDSEEYKVVIVKANTKISVEGNICYLSTTNVAELGDDYVITKNGGDALITAIGENMDGTEGTESGTEVEGAISEEELLLGEDGGMIFDFGEEETENDSQYTDVYTYIIFK